MSPAASTTDGDEAVFLIMTIHLFPFELQTVLEAVREAVGGAMPDGLDQLWFTEAPGAFFFNFAEPLRAGSDVLD
jgi:hypothetical protein